MDHTQLKELAVLTIHGIGQQPADFADEFHEQLRGRLASRQRDPSRVCWQPIHWSPVLNEREIQLWNDLTAEHNLGYERLRKDAILAIFADALAYRPVPRTGVITYNEIHKRVHSALSISSSAVVENAPVIVIAHSLGAMIVSDYVWDRQNWNPAPRESADPFGDTPFERFETMAGFITFGCNIPLFTLAYDPIECIQFPGSGLTENKRAKSRWFNYYSPYDVLGYPLKPLSDSYRETVTEDIRIQVGGLLALTPLSHSRYWSNGRFLDEVAEFIATFLE